MDRSSFYAVQNLSLHPQTGVPLYLQLQRHLEGLIAKGELIPGTTLPSERDLADFLEVSRITVKRAYAELRAARLVSSHGRLGTVVAQAGRLDPVMDRLKGFTDEMRELGMVPSSRILERAVVQDRVVASIFGLPSNARLLKLVRVRSGDGKPLSREVAWYNLSLAPQIETEALDGSVYAVLRDVCGVAPAWCEQSVEAVLSSPDEGEVFGFPNPQPCLLIKRRTFAKGSRMVEYVEGTFRGDAYAYRLRMGT